MRPWHALILLLAAPSMAQDGEPSRLAALEATIETQAARIATLEETLAARPDAAMVESLRNRIRTLSVRAATLGTTLESCRRDQRQQANRTQTLEREAARMQAALRAAETENNQLNRDLRRAEDEARRAGQDVRRLRSDLQRCR